MEEADAQVAAIKAAEEAENAEFEKKRRRQSFFGDMLGTGDGRRWNMLKIWGYLRLPSFSNHLRPENGLMGYRVFSQAERIWDDS